MGILNRDKRKKIDFGPYIKRVCSEIEKLDNPSERVKYTWVIVPGSAEIERSDNGDWPGVVSRFSYPEREGDTLVVKVYDRSVIEPMRGMCKKYASEFGKGKAKLKITKIIEEEY
ncbi:MAG: hypothetical protein HZB68_04790 [Candidatus Aenigmarchaeota archaeon]|nr:hypothetical protein [Candidatus Aenigmarchaeota archaeon]